MAGFKFAVVGVLYAVLLAFAVIIVWKKFSSAEGVVALEAGAAAAIYRLGAHPSCLASLQPKQAIEEVTRRCRRPLLRER